MQQKRIVSVNAELAENDCLRGTLSPDWELVRVSTRASLHRPVPLAGVEDHRTTCVSLGLGKYTVYTELA